MGEMNELSATDAGVVFAPLDGFFPDEGPPTTSSRGRRSSISFDRRGTVSYDLADGVDLHEREPVLRGGGGAVRKTEEEILAEQARRVRARRERARVQGKCAFKASARRVVHGCEHAGA